ncbi:unnamed protein product [Allacma fusca]|uniref:Chitin-binding type-2 domain-containing protein n=1 Tax=Allacma fusca TaxID=39272 RepID=A0A8J2K3V4_9HEXA|nr:unnamed protein product [Allacma fusca]
MDSKLICYLGVLISISAFLLCPVVVEGIECTSNPNYVYPNPKDCTSFYKCWNGKLYPFTCPDPLVFNTELLVCDWKWNVLTCYTEIVTDYGLGSG